MAKGEDADAAGAAAASVGSSYDKLSWCDSWMKGEGEENGRAGSAEGERAALPGTLKERRGGRQAGRPIGRGTKSE